MFPASQRGELGRGSRKIPSLGQLRPQLPLERGAGVGQSSRDPLDSVSVDRPWNFTERILLLTTMMEMLLALFVKSGTSVITFVCFCSDGIRVLRRTGV